MKGKIRLVGEMWKKKGKTRQDFEPDVSKSREDFQAEPEPLRSKKQTYKEEK